MYKIIYPLRDATIYERYPNKNTGIDQILELQSVKVGQPTTNDLDETVYWDATFNSRILIKFQIPTDLSSSISGKNLESYLILRCTEAQEIPLEYNLYAYPVSDSWTNGNGYFSSSPEITNGVTWKQKSNSLNDEWSTSSYSVNETGSWATTPGGANWLTSSFGVQEFNYQQPDIRMNVTNVVKSWLSGSFENNGFIIKFSDQDEQSLDVFGTIQFFSKDTHTIYSPRLEFYWNDAVLSATGSYDVVDSDNYSISLNNLQETYTIEDKPVLRVFVGDRYITQTYSTSSAYLNKKRFPTTTYYSIVDSVTDEVLVPFNEIGTIVNCDNKGNYIKLDCSSLMPERYYKILFKCNFSDGSTIVINNNYIFRVTRK